MEQPKTKDYQVQWDQKDLIYGSDQDAQAGLWLKTAYALKARYTMRLLNKSANQTTDLQNILTYVSKSFTNANEGM